MILYTLLFTPQGYEYKLLQRYIQTLPQTTLFMASLSLITFQSHHTVTTTHKLQTIHGS